MCVSISLFWVGRSAVRPSGGEHPSAEAKLLFFDDFRSGQLDRSKWNVRTTGNIVNNEQQAYIDSPETIYVAREGSDADNNVLVLQARHRPGYTTSDGQSFDFISGRIDTRERFQFTYGSVSARMKLSAGPGLWPAFWMMGAGAWPETGEIDVMENVGQSDWVSCAVHGQGYSGEDGLVNKLFFPVGIDATDWHVYGVDWTPDRLIFTVDGSTVYRVTRPMVDFFGSWAFDNEKFLILNLALGGVYPFKTNGIHSPYPGIAEETVAGIRNDDAKVMVDWVQVVGTGGPTEAGSTSTMKVTS